MTSGVVQQASGVNLPELPVSRHKLLLTLGVGSYTVLIYGVAGRLATQLSPQMLSLSSFDLAIPVIPWTFWIYSSVYFIYLSSSALQKDDGAFSKFLYGYIVAYSLSAAFFLLYPTTFPREQFPPMSDGASLSADALVWFRQIDLATNCFPSMHVASAVMSALPFYGRRPRLFALFSLWALLISVTTLTTKQHYIIDVVAGGGFGALIHLGVGRYVRLTPKTELNVRT